MSNMRVAEERGYMAMIAVLIIGAASLAIGTGMLLIGVDNQKMTFVTQDAVRARNVAVSCVEEALQRIHEFPNFVATDVSVSINAYNCSYTITSTGANTRQIDASSTVGGVVRKVRAYVTIGTSSISITSWQEVS